MIYKTIFLLILFMLVYTSPASARLEVCNQTDLVLMVAIGYDTTNDRIASEGWWRVYPGYCDVLIDVAMLAGFYYVHAESNLSSTMPGDAFSWGDEKSLCVEFMDYRIPNSNDCADQSSFAKFNLISKNWRNTNIVEIHNNNRRYENLFRARVAGVQRMMSVLGYDVGVIDGVLGEKTVAILDEIGTENGVMGFDFKKIFPIFEQLITKNMTLDN